MLVVDEFKKLWGDNIRSQREAREWTQAELARRLNVSRVAVGYWECGRSAPTDARKLAIARTFGLSVRTLFPLVAAAA